MDAQLRRALLEGLVLAVLRKGDSYGYKIVKAVSEHLEISESTLYPILRRLETEGMLEYYTEEHQGRLRKYYRITENGIRRHAEFAEDLKSFCKIANFITGGSENE